MLVTSAPGAYWKTDGVLTAVTSGGADVTVDDASTAQTCGGGSDRAFKNPDGSLVAVMHNAGSAQTMTVALAGKKLEFAMPADGWATVVSR